MRVATNLIEHPARDGRLLVVWNRKLVGWTLPGGKVEPGEEPFEAAARELTEETGLHGDEFVHYYEAEPPEDEGPSRPDRVIVYKVRLRSGDLCRPREREAGCPVGFLFVRDFLACSPVRAFYRLAFAYAEGWPLAGASL